MSGCRDTFLEEEVFFDDGELGEASDFAAVGEDAPLGDDASGPPFFGDADRCLGDVTI